MRRGGAIVVLLLVAAAGAGAEVPELSGELRLQGRWYPESPAFPDQRSGAGSLVVEPTLHWETEGGTGFTLTPFYRHDSADSRRTQADLREAYMLAYGDWGENIWELRLGLDRVFWGVAELQNLVDIVNQSDIVGHPRDRPKLGQPMAYLAVSGDWGIAESFLLPYHRKRTFPGRSGRLRSAVPPDDKARYESGAGERHVDLAFRYSNAVGLLDFGLSAFAGTSREPSFLVGPGPSLVPYYEQIRQFGIDAQLTTEDWLYKVEAIRRGGARNLLGREEDYHAFVLGLERTFYELFDSPADLTVFTEWHRDGRDRRATNALANDFFVMGLIAFNDVEGTELAAGILGDLRDDSRTLNLELKRRLSNRWSMRLEAIANLSVDRRDLAHDTRRDSYLGAELTYGF